MADNNINRFQSHVTSTAFSLSLSRNMIDELLCLGYMEPRQTTRFWAFNHTGTKQSLVRRGLVETWAVKDDTGNFLTEAKLTEAGKILCQLLSLAGFKFDPYPWELGEDVVKMPEPQVTLKDKES